VLFGQIMDTIKALTDSVTEVQKIHVYRRTARKVTVELVTEMKAESPEKGHSVGEGERR